MMKHPASLHKIDVKCLLSGLLLCFTCLQVAAQQFSVRSFRLLPNDISAYIDPVKDLNQEACALIKVVADCDFVFSTPLGIVRRRNEVGETWIYLPNGSVLLTIKHPQWGVLRDYRLPTPLESRLTYELVLSSPITYIPKTVAPIEDKPAALDTTLYLPDKLSSLPYQRPKRPRERWHFLLLANGGIHRNGPSAGIQIAAMRRHGAYLHLQSDFHSMPDTQQDCNRDGIPTGETIAPYYTGRTFAARRMFLAGGIHRLFGNFCLYEGIGYGRRIVAWEEMTGDLFRNTAYSAQGISAELGGVLRVKQWAVSAGVITIAARHWEATVGFGLHF